VTADRERDVARLAAALRARNLTGRAAQRYAEILLPVVDAMRREYAAEQLDTAAERLWSGPDRQHLRDRAAALRADP
jgi:hypothetical protein